MTGQAGCCCKDGWSPFFTLFWLTVVKKGSVVNIVSNVDSTLSVMEETNASRRDCTA